MARALIKRWKLAVLRVGLDSSGRSPAVWSRLDGYDSGSDVTYWERTDPLDAFGLSNTADFPRRVDLPRALVQAVRTTMNGELRRESALWLRLQPPYGYLGAAPWEDLMEEIDVPVFRVPDRLPTPTPLGRTWSIAIAVSAPRGASWGARHVREFTDALAERLGDGFKADVFCDGHTHELLSKDRYRLQDATIRVHDPAESRHAHRRRASRSATRGRGSSGARPFDHPDDPRLLWSDWIIDGLHGRAVRALHVAAAGMAGTERPMLAIARDPSRAVPISACASVETEDLSNLADALGASLVSIAAPEAHGPDVGARMAADNLGQQRPSATVFSSMRRDPGCRTLAQVHAFLASPGLRSLPSDRSWFGYIQPESVQDVFDEPLLPHHTGQEMPTSTTSDYGLELEALTPQRRSSGEQDALSSLTKMFAGSDQVPTWVASSSRFVEARTADLGTVLSTPGVGKTSKHAYDLGSSGALADIQALVRRHISSGPSGSES